MFDGNVRTCAFAQMAAGTAVAVHRCMQRLGAIELRMVKSYLGTSIATTIAGPLIAYLVSLVTGVIVFGAGVAGIAWSVSRLVAIKRRRLA
jgi:hypothetical protein